MHAVICKEKVRLEKLPRPAIGYSTPLVHPQTLETFALQSNYCFGRASASALLTATVKYSVFLPPPLPLAPITMYLTHGAGNPAGPRSTPQHSPCMVSNM